MNHPNAWTILNDKEWIKQHVRGSMPVQSIDYYEKTHSDWRNEEAIECMAAEKLPGIAEMPHSGAEQGYDAAALTPGG